MKTLFSFLLLILFSTLSVDGQEIDSLETPFRKARWLTGLSGTISSGSTDVAQSQDFANQYGITIATGVFMIPRFLLGIYFNTTREQSNRYIRREAETLFIGPSVAYYLSKAKLGSPFIGVSPGYARFREEASFILNNIAGTEELEGDGFGFKFTFGYSYVLHDRIGFDLGLIMTTYRIRATRQTYPGNIKTNETVNIGNLTFFFGFNVLLDQFSF